ncbi:hypothetical protein ACFE04_031274 [Oxalis oulophora]
MGSHSTAIQEPLGRQSSLYNLTLDEVQNQLGNLGKPLGSMNIDELLNSLLNSEAHQGTEIGIGTEMGFSHDLSKKTVEEVWREIQEKKNGSLELEGSGTDSTFGNMTLEDFLKKAEVFTKNSPPAADVVPWGPYQLAPVQHPHQQQLMATFFQGNSVPQPFAVANNSNLGGPYPETQMTVHGSLSNTKALGRKRVAHDDIAEKTVERKQSRMIKNRESAARSRARRQAYTNELENKVLRLEEENERLRRQKEFKLLENVPPPEPKHQLRRTSSALF